MTFRLAAQAAALALLLGSTAIAPTPALARVQAAAPQVAAAQAVYADGAYTLSWTAKGPVRVYASADPAAPLAKMKLLGRPAGSSAIFRDPVGVGVRPYFYVAGPFGAGVRTATRVVPLEGVANFRDLGGYEGAGGRHVKWGKLFRANALAELTPADFRAVNALSIRLICDLRAADERRNQPTHWQGGREPEFLTSAKTDVVASTKTMLGDGPPTAQSARRAIMGFYERAPDDYAPEYKAMFARLLKGETPMIVHCTAGKDRTGVASALVLTALGVPRPTVEADYSMSADLLKAGQARREASPGYKANMALYSKMPPEAMAAMSASEPAFIDTALDAAAAKYGSVDAYLEKVLGVGPAERAALRARYLE